MKRNVFINKILRNYPYVLTEECRYKNTSYICFHINLISLWVDEHPDTGQAMLLDCLNNTVKRSLNKKLHVMWTPRKKKNYYKNLRDYVYQWIEQNYPRIVIHSL